MNKCIVFTSIVFLLFGAGCSDSSTPSRDFSFEVQSLDLESQDPGAYESEVAKLKKLADSDNPIAQYRYADLLLHKGSVGDAIPYLQRSIALGDQHSAELLGILYVRNDSKKDDLEGFELLTQAAESGLGTAQLYLGFCFTSDECKLPHNVELSYYWLNMAKDNGSSEANLFIDDVSELIPDKALAMQRYDENVKKVICEMDSSRC
ncbi:tetratricopeptide repeat protein [Corallincola spongiicola]|uniref:Sel1 repeat family protein n=1 Tax=Corallincola spongiicola TaxID=2520508 RepID=A0ABY1WLM1_9GAMM|nr:sel1 repeat family protein [Corallincola spongiicola]TAA41805.1 sel1 repeat family protein [Corallincola spongiicola]